MIEIKMTGMCEDCLYANLELQCLENGAGQRIWTVHCIHERACENMRDRAKEGIEDEND